MNPIRGSVITAAAFAAVAAVFLPGCEEDGVRRYTVDKERVSKEGGASPIDGPGGNASGSQAQATSGPQRILAAIVPQGDRNWFFKIMGKPEKVGQQEDSFRQFVQSVRFQGGQPQWDLPSDWQETQGGGRMRFATIKLGQGGDAPEMSVIPLPSSGLLANVNRWRGQVGLKPVSQDELSKMVERLEVSGRTVTLVDLKGPGGGGSGSMRAPFAGGSSGEATGGGSGSASPSGSAPPSGSGGAAAGGAASDPGKPISYDVPDGWQQNPSGSRMRVASLMVEQSNQTADVSVIPLRGSAGGTLQNVNRWRRQIGLQPISQEQLDQELETIQVGQQKGQFVDLAPPQPAPGDPERILAVMVKRGERTWFFKMRGPNELVADQTDEFKAFVRSVRFNADGQGDGNE